MTWECMIFPDMRYLLQAQPTFMEVLHLPGLATLWQDVKGNNDRLGWDEVNVMIRIIFRIVLELCVILDR